MWTKAARAATCALALAWPAAGHAQDSRAALLQQQRAAKAARLEPYQPGRLERLLLYVEDQNPLGRIAPRNGLFVRYGYPDKPVGAGIGVGGGYRRDLFGRTARMVVEGGQTLRNYQLVRGDVSLPWLLDERLEVGVEGSYRHNPQEDFYGSGPASRKGDRVDFTLETTALLARALVRPAPWLEAGVHVGRLSPSVGRGTDARDPSIEDLFSDADAPGLASQPVFAYRDLVAAVDYRDQPGNARTGGYYSVRWAQYSDDAGGRYDFTRVELQGQQFVPIFDEKRVFAVQARVITSHPGDGARVPFYLEPTLGGSTTLRSVPDYRFRDANLLQFNAEYRWEAFSGLDMALFSDWGTVAPRPGDLDAGDLEHAYGVGFRFNTFKSVFLRIDVGTGAGDGVHSFFRFSKAY